MKLSRWMTLLAVTGAMASTPLFAQQTQEMQDQSGTMSSDPQAQSPQDVPWANQQASQDAARKLQQALKDKGHDVGQVDGLIGPKTQAALKDFQQSQGMDASGEINAETLTALGIDRSEFAAFGVQEPSGDQSSPGAMDQGTSGKQDNSGAAMPNNVPPASGQSQ